MDVRTIPVTIGGELVGTAEVGEDGSATILIDAALPAAQLADMLFMDVAASISISPSFLAREVPQ